MNKEIFENIIDWHLSQSEINDNEYDEFLDRVGGY
jgi:hypothetical protein